MTRTFSRRALRLPLLLGLALPLAACGNTTYFANEVNKGMVSQHQPVVSHNRYVFDVATPGGHVSPGERARLIGWLDSLDVGYGDHVGIAAEDSMVSPGVRDAIAEVLSYRGMLIEEDPTAAVGQAPYGSVRVVLRRSTAAVPNCPRWKDAEESNMTGGLSTNYGCAVNGNIAAMVADPEDLVRGQSSNSDLRTATSNLAIRTLREKQPTGSGELKPIGGN